MKDSELKAATITVSAEAYKRKEELGGGYKGVAIVKYPAGSTKKLETKIYDTQNAAWVDVGKQIWAIGTPYSVAHFKSNRYKKNYFILDNS